MRGAAEFVVLRVERLISLMVLSFDMIWADDTCGECRGWAAFVPGYHTKREKRLHQKRIRQDDHEGRLGYASEMMRARHGARVSRAKKAHNKLRSGSVLKGGNVLGPQHSTLTSGSKPTITRRGASDDQAHSRAAAPLSKIARQ